MLILARYLNALIVTPHLRKSLIWTATTNMYMIFHREKYFWMTAVKFYILNVMMTVALGVGEKET